MGSNPMELEPRPAGERIGDWDESPPERTRSSASLENLNPMDKPEYSRPMWIRKRREAGLPDYPPQQENES